MSIVRRNIIANTAGRGWAALLSLAVLPVYLHFLGIEAFGLIGFFLSLTLILQLLDLGLGTALNRQFAQYSMQSGKAQEMHDLLRTLEIIYWLIGIAIGVTIAALAPAIAAYWLKPQQLSAQIVSQALAMMGIAIAFQWPRALYSGGLVGLQRQVASNLLSSITGTVNNLGGVLILWLVSPTLQAYVAWFMAISLVDTLSTGLLLWRSLPEAPARPTFRPQALAGIWRFAAGMTGISITSVIQTQLDKVILVKVLPLDAFGYYSLASRVAGGLSYLTSPISAAFFPRFSQLLLVNDRQELARLYHRSCQLMSVLVLPPAVVLTLFSYELLFLWTQDRSIAENSYLVLGLLTAGTAFNALASLPYALQLASELDTALSYCQYCGYPVASSAYLYHVREIRWRRRGNCMGYFQCPLYFGGPFSDAPALVTGRAIALVPLGHRATTLGSGGSRERLEMADPFFRHCLAEFAQSNAGLGRNARSRHHCSTGDSNTGCAMAHAHTALSELIVAR